MGVFEANTFQRSVWSDYNIAYLLQVLIRHDARLPATWVVVANVESGCSMPRHSICHYVLQITAGGERAGRVVHGSQDTRRSRGATPPTRSGRWRDRESARLACGTTFLGRFHDHGHRERPLWQSPQRQRCLCCVARVWRRI